MQATIDTSDYYTFEEAAHALGFSLAHVYRAVSYDVFHPVRLGKGARKHLLKSEVDAKIGQPLYSRRKTKQHDMDNPGIPVQSSPQMGAFLSSMNELVPIIAHGYSQAVTAPVVASFAHTLDTIISALLGKDNPSINPAMLQQFRQETERVYQMAYKP
jgi:predicted DNA-binding transcriptional regulator AlpA